MEHFNVEQFASDLMIQPCLDDTLTLDQTENQIEQSEIDGIVNLILEDIN